MPVIFLVVINSFSCIVKITFYPLCSTLIFHRNSVGYFLFIHPQIESKLCNFEFWMSGFLSALLNVLSVTIAGGDFDVYNSQLCFYCLLFNLLL